MTQSNFWKVLGCLASWKILWSFP